MRNVAIVVDSGTDIPKKYRERYGIFELPLHIQYEALSYRDKIDITTEQVIDRLEMEIPRTSLPSVGEILLLLRKIRAKGFRDVIVVTISSALSGTCGILRMAAREAKGLRVRVVDSKSISLGAGITAIRAAELAESGMTMEQILPRLQLAIEQTKVFLCADTLKYMQKSGRINARTAAMGTIFGIRPIFSCNAEGAYYAVGKVRGSREVVDALVEQVAAAVGEAKRFDLVVAHICAKKRAKELEKALRQRLPGCGRLIVTQVGPALAVHSGPGLIGAGVQVF